MDPFTTIREMVVSRLKPVMAAVGAETRDYVKETINTPYPPSSAPGSPPHRRTGRLHDGITHEQTVLPDLVRETVRATRTGKFPAVPQYLEEGTPTMAPRPFMRPARNFVAETVLANVAGKLKL